MIIDSHTHVNIGKDPSMWRGLIDKKKLGMLINAASPREFNFAKSISESENLRVSFGIHPWDVEDAFGKFPSEDAIDEKLLSLISYYKEADAVGEIGMDGVWCECGAELQKQVFIKQLEIARELKKPVVLHTKGYEKEVADIIKDYKVKKLVHWYSCGSYLENYLVQDCYFTVGPNFDTNEYVEEIIQRVPLHRLLVETDGIEALRWAREEELLESDIPRLLKKAVRAIAKEKNIANAMAEYLIEENFGRFLTQGITKELVYI